MRSHHRGTVIGESSNPGQTIFSGTRHRRTGYNKSESEDEAGDPHLTVSGLSLSALGAVFVGSVDNHAAFPEFCAKSPKWFRRDKNCFVACLSTKQLLDDINDFSSL
jgi:hypothetical protein